MIKYRSDIDSLRGYAVVAVILYHFKVPFFQGGYIGVDIFFVISGYLITSIIFREIMDKKFDFINFYERRIRRIIPILFFVLIISILVQNKLFLYDEKIDFYKIILSIIFFVSNLWFAQSGSYFEPDVSNSHLLHTWSLSIEEQFYLIFPIFLFLIYKRNLILILIVLFLISFLLANNGGILKKTFPFYDNFEFIKMPSNSFYLLPTRIWELLAGSIISILKIRHINFVDKISIQKNILNVLGYTLIFLSFIFFNDKVYHPSVFTLIPILGISILLLFEIENKFWLKKIINNKAMQNIGLISYSLYLWHLPILYFYIDYFGPKKFQIYETIILIIVSFVFSILSYNFIEKVFRRKIIFNRGITLIIFFITTTLISVICFYKINYQNFKKNYPVNINKVVDEKKYYKKKFFKDCLSDPKKYISPKSSCILGNKNKISYAFIGDSHMGILSKELDKVLKIEDLGGRQFTYNGCLPSNELKVYNQPRYKCQKYYNELINFLRKEKNIKTVIFYYRWGLYYNGKRFNNLEGGIEKGKDHIVIKSNQLQKSVNNINDLNFSIYNFFKEIKKLNKDIIIIKSTPEMGWEIPGFLAKKLLIDQKVDKNFLSIDKKLYKERNYNFDNFINKIKKEFNLKVYNPEKIFCDKKRCFAFENNFPLFYDDDHLSSFGSKKLSVDLVDFIKEK